MPTYLSPGVYVEELPSAVKPIAGVGTSTAGFIGIVPDKIEIPEPNPGYDPTRNNPADDEPKPPDLPSPQTPEPPPGPGVGRRRARQSGGDGNKPYILKEFPLRAPPGLQVLVTNFSEFEERFGTFSTDEGHRNLAHAVYGFFNNGGTRCFVVREKDTAQIATSALKRFEAIDEIALVATPGIVEDSVREAVLTHCEAMEDRFGLFDAPEMVQSSEVTSLNVPRDSQNGAFYFPWIRVFDPAAKIRNPKGDGKLYVPPSGHVAGIYARVDTERGVHKAPANEVVRGALGLKSYVSKAEQEGLNPVGVNCIRDLNGSIRVWGARTIGGDRNGEWKYVSVRRLFLFLKESIDEGTQWVVFEPNTSSLWGKIKRNVSAFLTNVWRDGALFGTTPEQAFYVKCDEETNPAGVRDLGQVVTEIGVAIARPAEFVIFRITQWAGPKPT